MKKVVLAIIVLFITSLSFAQVNKAKSLLDDVAKKVASYKNIYIDFKHKLDNKEADVHQETRGNVTLSGDLYHLNYMGTEQIFDGTKKYLIIHEDEEVIIQNNNTEEASLTPSKMLTFYKKGYNYKMDKLKTIKGRKIQFVKLTPINSDSEISYILIGIDQHTKHIKSVIETGKNNTQTTLEINTFKTNQNISEKLFIFDTAKYRDQKKYIISEPN